MPTSLLYIRMVVNVKSLFRNFVNFLLAYFAYLRYTIFKGGGTYDSRRKIKKIRTFRGMTQKELGLAIGFEEKGADNRIAQYETNYRVPKRELLDKIAQALRVDRQNFYTVQPGCAEDFMRTFFWLDEDSPGSIRLFQLVRNPGKIGASDDTAVRYNDTDDWPAQPPVGIYFNYGLVDEFMREWLLRQQELHAGEITREEYFEWKINWPLTCDDSKRFDNYVPWRKEK